MSNEWSKPARGGGTGRFERDGKERGARYREGGIAGRATAAAETAAGEDDGSGKGTGSEASCGAIGSA